jgi:pimeloyl-ACP methyl ester carboxylesterase
MIDYINTIDLIRREYNWDKISIMGHSLGSILLFMYAAIYPERVSMLIGIDALRPGLVDEKHQTELLIQRMKQTMVADERNQKKTEPPSYTYEDLLERFHVGTNGSVSKNVAPALLRRNVRRSEKNPGKYYFTRDSRLKSGFKVEQPHYVSMELAKNINVPFLTIKASKHIYYGPRKEYEEIVEVLQKNPNFFHHTIEARHHLHLTDPELVAPLITDFIYKYSSRSKL